jgi:hypothetical protein
MSDDLEQSIAQLAKTVPPPLLRVRPVANPSNPQWQTLAI